MSNKTERFWSSEEIGLQGIVTTFWRLRAQKFDSAIISPLDNGELPESGSYRAREKSLDMYYWLLGRAEGGMKNY